MLEIEARHLDAVREILGRRVPGCEVRAFGSRVRGSSWKHSDLDLAILSPDGKSLEWRVVPSVVSDFQESRVPFRVDVLDYYAVPDNFRKIIDENYEIISEKRGG